MQSDSFFSFQSAHVLITGASGGIGLVLAQNYLNHGCRVTLQYNQNRSPLEILEEKYSKYVYIHSADMREETSVIDLFTKAKEKFGMINILIANHGIEENDDVPVWQMSLKQWNNTINVNLTGVFLACREYLKGVKLSIDATPKLNDELRNLSIILIASTAALFGEAYHSDYAASKSALFGFMKSLKNEIVKIHERIRINCVAPGWVRTPMAEKAIEAGQHLKALHTTPLKKIATPEDVANAVLFLSSEKAAGHLTGSTLKLHGGMEGRMLNKLEDLQK